MERDLLSSARSLAVESLTALVELFEHRGLVYFDDFFEMSGNWPEWLSVFAVVRAG